MGARAAWVSVIECTMMRYVPWVHRAPMDGQTSMAALLSFTDIPRLSVKAVEQARTASGGRCSRAQNAKTGRRAKMASASVSASIHASQPVGLLAEIGDWRQAAEQKEDHCVSLGRNAPTSATHCNKTARAGESLMMRLPDEPVRYVLTHNILRVCTSMYN